MITLASASGNLFGYLWAADVPPDFHGPTWARRFCPRGKGLGWDGLFLLHPFVPGQVWHMAHWEPDGSETFCSNGTRAAFACLPHPPGHVQVMCSGERVDIHAHAGQVALRMPEGESYGLQHTPEGLIDLPHALGWTGTPHLIVEVPNVVEVDLAQFAPPLRFHPKLPEGANVSIIQILQPGLAKIRSWERGVEGETLCCGQGCAVAGAWLAQRGQGQPWRMLPSGEDPVDIHMDALTGNAWQGLWLAGPVRTLGRFIPHF